MITRRSLIRSLCATIPVFSLDQLLAGAGSLGVQFFDVAKQAGLTHKTIFGAEGRNKYLLETTGCGVASESHSLTMTTMDGLTSSLSMEHASKRPSQKRRNP
jgi:hypothetical protein